MAVRTPATSAAKPGTDLATLNAQGTTLAKPQELPEYLKGTAKQGLEEMGREDMILPRIAIAQTLSPALNKKKPGFIQGLLVGQLYNTVTREILGEVIRVVPILFSKNRILFGDINKGGGILCQSPNAINGGHLSPSGCAACPKSRFVDNEAPECNLFMNYPALVMNGDKASSMAAVSMKSTSLSEAKKWNSLMRMSNVASFGRVHEVRVIEDSRDSNDFYNFKITQLGFTPELIYRAAEAFYESLRAQGVKVDLDGIHEEDGNTNFDPAGM